MKTKVYRYFHLGYHKTIRLGWVKPAFRVIRFHDKAYYLNFPCLIFCLSGNTFYVFASKEYPIDDPSGALVYDLPLPNIHGSGQVCLGDTRSFRDELDAACAFFWNSNFCLTDSFAFSYGLRVLSKIIRLTKRDFSDFPTASIVDSIPERSDKLNYAENLFRYVEKEQILLMDNEGERRPLRDRLGLLKENLTMIGG